MSKKFNTAVDSWERQLRKALEFGKGRYRSMLVYDVFDHLEIIKLIRSDKFGKAYEAVQDLDTMSRDFVPVVIYDRLTR